MIPAETMMRDLQQWNLPRGELDRHLLVGWYGQALIGGALSWRSHLLVTGASGTGKSELCRALVDYAGGPRACIYTADCSEAGLRVDAHKQTVPIFLDEAELESDSRAKSRLMRCASGGDGAAAKRSDPHQHKHEFFIASAFALFSCTAMPQAEVDQNRFVAIELGPLPTPARPVTAPERGKIGSQNLTLMLTQAGELPQTVMVYRDVLAAAGWPARRAEVLAAVFSGAHLLRLPGQPATRAMIGKLFQRLQIERLQAAVIEAEHERARDHLYSTRLPFIGHPQHPVSAWIEQAGDPERQAAADKVLAEHGLKLLRNDAGQAVQLAVAFRHRAMQEIAAAGGWSLDILRRLPGAVPGKWRFAGLQSRGVAIALDAPVPPVPE
jgi:hypothetical protein